MQIISKDQYQRATWKNGLGYTDQIAIYPPQAELERGNFLWRLSSARIEQDSPFSPFPEHDRVLVILSGKGVRLTHTFDPSDPPEVAEIPLLSPYEFPGDIPSTCDLLSGPVVDLSVFIRKGELESSVDVRALEAPEPFEWSPQGQWNFVFAAEGTFEIEGHALKQSETLRLELDGTAAISPLRIHGTGRLVFISLSPL